MIDQVEVVVLGQILSRDQALGIPVQAQIINELMILITEKEPVLPILLVFIDDLLLNLASDCD